MNKFFSTLVLVACTALAGSAADSQPSITVSGNGKVSYIPDIGYIHVGVASEGWTAAEAWQKNEAVVKKIFDALKEFGIAEKDFKTSNLNVQPRYQHKPNEEPKFLGYTVSYDLVVTARKLDQMGKLLDRMVDAGANRNMNISFGCSKMDELLDQAREKAVADARKKANLYVTGAGAYLGNVLSISDVPTQLHNRMFPVDAMAMKETAGRLPIAAGEQDVNANVTIRWAINNHPQVSRVPAEG